MTDAAALTPEDAAALVSEHRDLDALLGAFLAAASGGALAASVDAIARLDDAIRVHSRFEESLFPAATGKLVARAGETPREKLFRDLRLEHVQIRELSGMIRRVLGESGDLGGARALATKLVARWESHTTREETEWLAG